MNTQRILDELGIPLAASWLFVALIERLPLLARRRLATAIIWDAYNEERP